MTIKQIVSHTIPKNVFLPIQKKVAIQSWLFSAFTANYFEESASLATVPLSSSATAIGVGGDPIIGTTLLDSVQLFMDDDETDVIVLIGEIGGQLEIDAAKWIKNNGNKKPVVGFIAGETAPKGRKMGHAGAIVGGKDDTASAKKRIMRESGILVVDSPADIGKSVKEILG